jgi:DNA-binding protein HU-beta
MSGVRPYEKLFIRPSISRFTTVCSSGQNGRKPNIQLILLLVISSPRELLPHNSVARLNRMNNNPLRSKPHDNQLREIFTMNRKDLIDALAAKTGGTKADADRYLAALIDIVTATLKKGDSVALVGFGTFEVRKRAARNGRNPATGAALKIKASKAPAFKAGATLKAAVNGKK